MDYSTDSADETEEQKNSIFEKKVLAKYPDMEFQRTSDGKSYYIGGATSEDDDLDNETSLAEETEEGEFMWLMRKGKKPLMKHAKALEMR